MICIVCESQSRVYTKDTDRSYFECQACELVFVPRNELISYEQEKARYDHHQNLESDRAYLSYLEKMAEGMKSFLKPGSLGLDFGCGRTTMLEKILEKDGFRVNSYDLYYFPESPFLKQKYDFIILSEVIEHLREPAFTMKELTSKLNPGGKIFIKTKFLPTREQFDRWFYKRDMTHIQFFNRASMKKIGELSGLLVFKELGEDLFYLGND